MLFKKENVKKLQLSMFKKNLTLYPPIIQKNVSSCRSKTKKSTIVRMNTDYYKHVNGTIFNICSYSWLDPYN